MFEKLKELNNIRELQNKIKQQKVTVEKNGVIITLNGAFDLLELKLNPDMAADRLEHLVKESVGVVILEHELSFESVNVANLRQPRLGKDQPHRSLLSQIP